MREPVAWLAFATDGSESRYVSADRAQAQEIADDYNWCVAPLYAGPPYGPLLADAERAALTEAANFYADVEGDLRCQQLAGALRELLARL